MVMIMIISSWWSITITITITIIITINLLGQVVDWQAWTGQEQANVPAPVLANYILKSKESHFNQGEYFYFKYLCRRQIFIWSQTISLQISVSETNILFETNTFVGGEYIYQSIWNVLSCNEVEIQNPKHMWKS